MSDQDVRDLYQYVLSQTARTRAECPSPEDLLAVAERTLSADRRLVVLDHVAGCARCLEDLRLLDAVAATGRGTLWTRRPAILALAASLAVTIGGALVWQLTPSQPDVLRGVTDQVVLVAPVGGTQPGPLAFTWRASRPATRYHLEVLDPAGSVLFKADGTDTTVALPASTQITPGTEYRWRVVALLPDGTRRQSAAEPFRIVAP